MSYVENILQREVQIDDTVSPSERDALLNGSGMHDHDAIT